MECPCCGCSEVVKDKIGSHEQQICTECGYVLGDETFEDASNCYFDAPSTGALPTGASVEMRAIKRDADRSAIFYSSLGLEEINATCQVLNLGAVEKDEATHLFNRICEEYSLGNIRFKSKVFKEVLGACCVYVTLRKHQYPITAKEIASLRKHKVNDFVIMLRRLKNFMKVEFPIWSISQLTAHTLKKCQFESEVIERTKQLVQICDKCWLVTGRKPESVIVTAAYLSWLSLQDVSIKRVTFKAFCKQYKFSVPSADGILNRMKTILIEMAKTIPWILHFKPENLRHYIEDIIKFNRSLLRKAFSKRSSNGEEETGLLPYKRKRTESDVPVELQTSEEIDNEITVKYGDQLDQTELDSSEFEDEMHQYLKTKKEIEDAKVIQHLNNSHDSSEK